MKEKIVINNWWELSEKYPPMNQMRKKVTRCTVTSAEQN